jgi:RNA polymerase sigma-70 factor (ECF subfamily)
MTQINPSHPDTQLRDFEQHRPAMFGLAYRMLGSAMDAEDIVQEAFLRWHRAPAAQVQSARSYLLTIVTRLCIDELRSARARREAYVGPWLPEPLVQGVAGDAGPAIEQAASLSFAFLLLLERLTPLERAVLILHDVFEYPYDEVAQLIGTNTPHCRQLGHRARGRVTAGRARFPAAPAQAEQAAELFARAFMDGDIAGLLALFAQDIALWTDGGGKVAAARNVVHGAERVARFFAGLQRKAVVVPAYRRALINGAPGLIGYTAEQADRIYSFDVRPDGRIQAIYCVRNPDKLWAAQHIRMEDTNDPAD